MPYQKLFISRPSEGTKPWPKFLAQKSLKKAKNNLKNLEKTPKKKQYSRTLAKAKIQKTSRKPKKNKKSKKTIFQDSCKSKHAKIQKTSRKPKKPKKNNVPGLLPVDPISRLLEYCVFCFFCFFFGFLEVFWIFAFLLLQESWNIGFFDFFVFFWFSRGFLDFCFCKSPGILFFILVFSRFFVFFDIVKPQVQIPIKHAKR